MNPRRADLEAFLASAGAWFDFADGVQVCTCGVHRSSCAPSAPPKWDPRCHLCLRKSRDGSDGSARVRQLTRIAQSAVGNASQELHFRIVERVVATAMLIRRVPHPRLSVESQRCARAIGLLSGNVHEPRHVALSIVDGSAMRVARAHRARIRHVRARRRRSSALVDGSPSDRTSASNGRAIPCRCMHMLPMRHSISRARR